MGTLDSLPRGVMDEPAAAVTEGRGVGRKIAAVVLGLAAWVVVASVADRLLRAAWPEYAAALPTFAFSLGMLCARQIEGAVATLATGRVVAAVAKGHRPTAVAAGIVLLLVFVPGHVRIWDKFPVWYHLLFLGSLVPLTVFPNRPRAEIVATNRASRG
jgi:hypothetical protein